MAQQPLLTAKGLYTNPNDLSEVPAGGLLQADDVVIRRGGIIEPRRGFSSGATITAFYQPQALGFYQNTLLVSGNLSSTWKLFHGTSGALTAYTGSFQPPNHVFPAGSLSAQMRFPVANRNLYLTTNAGIYKTDAIGTAPFKAGKCKALDLTGSLSGTNGGCVAGNSQVAYRVLWGTKDANSNLVLGAPSGRFVLTSAKVSSAVGGLSRAGTTVTVTVTSHPFVTNDVVTLDPGEANFPAGQKTITGTTPTTFTYTEAGAATTSSVVQTFYRTGRDVQLNITIPSEITSSDFYQVYRSTVTPDATVSPDDEMALVYEAAIPSAAVANIAGLTRSGGNLVTATTASPHGFTTGQYVNMTPGEANFASGLKLITVTGLSTFTYSETGSNVNSTAQETFTPKTLIFTDKIPDALRGAALYTNPSQEGILQANDRPPLCVDAVLWKGRMWFANTTAKHRLTFTILSASNMANNDTLTIAGQTYTAKATENVPSKQFLLATSGTTAQNIADTANSIVRCINLNLSNTTVNAFYLSGPTDQPGMILIEELAVGGSSFTAQASAHGDSFTPNLTSAQTSSNDLAPAGINYSKANQPEAAPILNRFIAGATEKHIRRIVALRDSLMVFKEDGVYRITGEDDATFRVDLFDVTITIAAPETAAVLSNAVYLLTEQGVVAVSDAGSSIVSSAIETDIIKRVPEATYAAIPSAFGVAYESEHQYLLWVNDVNAWDSSPAYAYVYSSAEKAWTKRTTHAACGLVAPVIGGQDTTTSLYVGSDAQDGPNQGAILFERKSFADSDFVDGANPISCAVQYAPLTAGNPALEKIVRDVMLFVSETTGLAMTATFSSDLVATTENVAVTLVSGQRITRVGVPSDRARNHWLNLKLAWDNNSTKISLNGITPTYEPGSEKVRV